MNNVKELWINDDHTELYLIKEDGSYINICAWADCCSRTYFNNIEDINLLIGAAVITIEDITTNLPDNYQKTSEERNHNDDYEHDNIVYYGIAIETSKGTCRIIYRNESNGYYFGDNCVSYWPTISPEELNVLLKDCKKIETDDWVWNEKWIYEGEE